MRLRKKPWADKEFAINDKLIEEPESMKGRWKEFFGNNNPIHLEIGCGKGQFIAKMSLRNPDINYIAAERQRLVIVTALRKSREMGTGNNLRFICVDVEHLLEYFEPGEIDRLYINFCDPWPRKKWAKRRLTHKNFLSIYEKLFIGGGEINFKTDNRGLFEFSLNEIEARNGWTMKNITLDLHNSEFEGNIMTEYEEKFSSKGMPIYRLEAYYNKQNI